MKRIAAILFILSAAAFAQTPTQFNSLSISTTDCSPTFNSPTVPAPGSSYADPFSCDGSTWGTTIKAISAPPAGTCNGNDCNHIVSNYSKWWAWNLDGAYMLVYAQTDTPGTPPSTIGGSGRWLLYSGTTYTYIRNLTCNGSNNPNDSEWLWSKITANTIYCFNALGMYSVDAATNVSTLVHLFTTAEVGAGATSVFNGEGNQSDNDRYWPFISKNGSGTQLQVFVYDKQLDVIQSSTTIATICSAGCVSFPNNPINWVSTSPSGTYVVINYNSTASNLAAWLPHVGKGTEIFTASDMSYRGYGSCKNGHADVGVDVNGTSVYVNKDECAGNSSDNYTIRVTRLSDSALFAYPLPSGSSGFNPLANVYWHIGMRATSSAVGWALFSTYKQNTGTTQATGWGGSENFAVKIDLTIPTGTAATFRRISRNYSIRDNDYYAEPHAVPNAGFSKILFSSNWLVDNGVSVNAYVVEMAPTAKMFSIGVTLLGGVALP